MLGSQKPSKQMVGEAIKADGRYEWYKMFVALKSPISFANSNYWIDTMENDQFDHVMIIIINHRWVLSHSQLIKSTSNPNGTTPDVNPSSK